MPSMYTLVATAVLAVFTVLTGATTYHYGRRDLLHPIVLVNGIMAYFVLVPATYFLATGMAAVPARFGLTNPERALTVALVVLLGMYVVIFVAFRRTSRYETTAVGGTLAGVFNDTNSSVLLATGLAGISIGLLIYGYYVFANGGLIRMLTVTPRTAFQTAPNTYRFRLLGLGGVFGGWATILCALRPALERRESTVLSIRQSFPIITLATVVTSITMFVAVSTRARMVILVPALIVLVYGHTAGWFSQRILVGVGSVVVMIGVSFSVFESLLNGYTIIGIMKTLIHSIVHIPRLTLVMVLTERVPDQASFLYGATIPEAFYIDLPGDPRYGNVVEFIATGTDKEGHFASAMFPGELWLNFGPVGILVGGVIYGMVLQWTYRLRESTNSLVRGIQPIVFICVLLIWPTNLTWGISNLFVRVLMPVLVAIAATLVIQRQFPSIARAVCGRIEISG